MRSGLLWGLLPDEAIPVLVLGAGLLCVIFGRRAIGFLVPLGLTILLAPFVESLVSVLPVWLVLALLALLGLALVRGVLGLVLGQRASDHVVGALAADGIRWLLRLSFTAPPLVIQAISRGLAAARRLEVRK